MSKKFLILLILIAVLSFNMALAAAEELTVLFTHDLHSFVLPRKVLSSDGKIVREGGYAELAYLINQNKVDGRTILVDAGDIAMGSLFHTLFTKEAVELRLMGMMGYDVITLGNHDFDFGGNGFIAMSRAAKKSGKPLPKIVATNTEPPPSMAEGFREHPVEKYVVLERSGLRIGIFGLMGKEAMEDASFAPPVKFGDQVKAAKEAVRVLREQEKVDVVICLSHSGVFSKKSVSEDDVLAEKVSGIDVIVSGHTHARFFTPLVVNKTLIVSAKCYGSYLGVLKLDVGKGGGVRLVSYKLISVDEGTPADPKIAAAAETFRKKVDEYYLSRFGMNSDDPVVRSGFNLETLDSMYGKPRETAIGDFVTDALLAGCRKYGQANAIWFPMGFIRNSILVGQTDVDDVFGILSLGVGTDGMAGDPMALFYVTGTDLKKMMEFETTIASDKPDAKANVAGLKFSYNPHRLPLDRITSLEVENENGIYEKVEPDKLYGMCTTLFTASLIGVAKSRSHGLIGMTLRRSDDSPVKDRNEGIIKMHDGREYYSWVALVDYLKSMPKGPDGIPVLIPEVAIPGDRIKIQPSWNPVDLISNGNWITKSAVAAIILALASALAAVCFIFWRGRK